jgi:glycosyltransferase involved in cell wall biosynthesis
VVPSVWWENSPLTVIEALAAGVAVVASRTGGVPELIDEGRTGLLVAPGDVSGLREALQAVVEGGALSEPLPPLTMKTTMDAAAELERLCASAMGRTEEALDR